MVERIPGILTGIGQALLGIVAIIVATKGKSGKEK